MDVISQKDIPQIVNALVENNKGANNVISAVIGSIKKITDAKATDVKLSDVKHVESLVLSYKNMLNNIISALCVDDNGQARDLHVLLGAMIDPDKSTKDKTVMKYKTVDAALQIPKVIDSMFGIISKVGDTEFSFKTIVKFKLNLWKLRSLMTGLFNDLLNVFSGINPNDEMDKLLKCLVKQPDVITQTNDILQTSEFEKIDNSTTVTQNGQLGILDVFAKTFEIINTLNTLKTPNFAMLEIRMLRVRLALKMVLNNLISWSKKNITNDTKEQLNTIETLLLGEKNSKGQREGGLQSVIQSMVGIMALSKRMKVNIVTLLLVNIALRGLGLIMDTIVKLSAKFEAISDKNIDAAITGAKKIFQMLGDIFKEITIIGLLAIPALVGALVGAIAILAICTFVWSIKLLEITINKAKLDGNALSSISDIITSLKQTMIDVLLIGLIAIPAVVAMIAVTLFVGALLLTTLAICAISKLIDSIAKNVNDNLKTLAATFGILMLIGISILVLALAAPVIIKALTENVATLLMVLLISVITLGIVTWIASVISRKAVGYSISLAVNILIIMGALMMAALVILVAAAVGNTLKDSDAIGAIILTIVGMIAIAAIMVGLGLALTAAAPGIGLAIAGLTPVAMLLGLLVATGLSIMSLAKFDFDFGTYAKGDVKDGDVGKGRGAMGNVGMVLSFVGWLRHQIGEKSKDDIKGARREKRFMKQIKNTVKRVVDIVEGINSISKLKLNKGVILENVKTVFGFTTELSAHIDTFLASDNKNNTPETTTAADTIKYATNKEIRKTKKKLNKVDNLLIKLVNVSDSLNSIQKLKIDEGTITSKVESIFKVIGKLEEEVKTNLNKTVTVEKTLFGVKYNKNIDATISKGDGKKMNRVDALMVNIKNICDALESVKKIKLDDNSVETIKSNVSKMFTAVSSINAVVEEESKNVKLDNETVELNERNINNYIRFIDSVNNIKVEQVKSTAQMFEKMSKFSSSIKGDFDKLAEALSDKMLPVLEDLKIVMSDVPEKLDKGFANTSASIAATTAPATAKNITAQVERENPNLTKKEVDTIVNQRMTERAQIDANSINAKLDELIGLFRGYNGNAIVKTI